MQVREANEENEVEMDFFTDVTLAVISKFKEYRFGYAKTLCHTHLEQLMLKSVGLKELRATGAFTTVTQANQFLNHYSQLDALLPKEIKESDQVNLLDQVERRIALLLGTQPSTKTARRKFGATISAAEHNPSSGTTCPCTSPYELSSQKQKLVGFVVGVYMSTNT